MLDGETSPSHWFGSEGVWRYELRTTAPDRRVSDDMRERMNELDKALDHLEAGR